MVRTDRRRNGDENGRWANQPIVPDILHLAQYNPTGDWSASGLICHPRALYDSRRAAVYPTSLSTKTTS